MQYSLLPHISEARDRSYHTSYSRPRDSKSTLKPIPQNAQAKYLFRLETVFQILYKNVHRHYYTFFKNLKTVSEIKNSQDYNLKVFRQKLDRFCYALYSNILKMEALGFFQLKNHVEGKLLLKRISSLLTRIAIKNLAISSRLVKHKKMLACSSAKTKLHQKSLKARYLMAICENIISKNDIPKELYKSFREWHLQSIIKKLKNLSENQKDMLYQQKTIVARHLRNCITKILTKTFYQLRRNVGSNEYITEKLSYTLSLNDLVEKISAPFLKHSLLLYPRANWNSNRMDTLSLLKVCQFFKKLQTFTVTRSQDLHDKSRGALVLHNVLQNRVFFARVYAFKQLMSVFSENDPPTKIRKQNNGPIIYHLLERLINKRKMFVFTKLLSAGIDKQRNQIKDSRTQQAFLILETLDLKCSQKSEQKTLEYNKNKVKGRLHTVKLQKLKNLLWDHVKDHLRWAFQSLREHSIENDFTVEETASTDTEISSETKILLDAIQNQALINAKLEKSYQRKALEGMALRYSYQQMYALAKINFKNDLRIQHNQAVVKNLIRDWQSRVAVSDNLLQVLENEINVYRADIQQIEQRKIEEAEIYLEFLEEDCLKLYDVINNSKVDELQNNESNDGGEATRESVLKKFAYLDLA